MRQRKKLSQCMLHDVISIWGSIGVLVDVQVDNYGLHCFVQMAASPFFKCDCSGDVEVSMLYSYAEAAMAVSRFISTTGMLPTGESYVD